MFVEFLEIEKAQILKKQHIEIVKFFRNLNHVYPHALDFSINTNYTYIAISILGKI